MRKASRIATQATTTGVDFGPHITGIIFSKIQNGYWVPIGDGESVKEGDQVRFYISYNIPDGKVRKFIISYQAELSYVRRKMVPFTEMVLLLEHIQFLQMD